MKEFLIDEQPVLDGWQKIYRFKNGYGASVVHHQYSKGTELAVIKFDEDDDWDICYDTKITNNVIGYLDKKHLKKVLRKIQKLKKD